MTENRKEVMVDIETMGRGNNAAIISIGAVLFDSVELEILRPFYQTVDLASAQKWGLDVEADTVMWWMEQSEEAKKALKEPTPRPLEDVLMSFREWFVGDKPLWGNGATFDNVVLRNAYNVTRMRCPWTYKMDRCYRTMKNMYPNVELPPDEKTAHKAYDDALWQTKHLFNIFKKMREVK